MFYRLHFLCHLQHFFIQLSSTVKIYWIYQVITQFFFRFPCFFLLRDAIKSSWTQRTGTDIFFLRFVCDGYRVSWFFFPPNFRPLEFNITEVDQIGRFEWLSYERMPIFHRKFDIIGKRNVTERMRPSIVFQSFYSVKVTLQLQNSTISLQKVRYSNKDQLELKSSNIGGKKKRFPRSDMPNDWFDGFNKNWYF